jgi:adenylate cyclase
MDKRKNKMSPSYVTDVTDLELRHAKTLLGISKKMAVRETLDQMLEALMDIITSELDAERCTIFLSDSETGELYSRVAHGNFKREIRILDKSGVAGHVFSSGEGMVVHDAYNNEFFNKAIDEKTGYKTQSIICTPIRTVRGDIIGVAQALNKKHGEFTSRDLELLDVITTEAAVVLQSTQEVEQMKKAREQEMEFFDVVSDVVAEIDLTAILNKVMAQATKMINSERSTLFLNDERTHELYSKVGEGLGAVEIRFPNHVGIAGSVFTSGQTINIPHAYADLRFNPSFDKQTGFFTRSILCVPVVNKVGKTIGVTQVLNKRGGVFTSEDEYRLKTFTAQVSIALENAQLFNDVQSQKNYIDSMLESMSNGVITLNEDGQIITCNAAGLSIMQVSQEAVLGRKAEDFFTGPNAWIMEKIKEVGETQTTEYTMDEEIEFGGKTKSINLTVLPLISREEKKPDTMIMMEDISTEKRQKSTLSRYMDSRLVDEIMAGGEEILGGKSTTATVLFSDIREFTTLTEKLGATGTVSLLNEYFTIMVDCIQREKGMLDKFIGDAIMAGFGIPVAHDDDEDRAVRTAVAMITSMIEWNIGRVAHGKEPVDMGIGVSTDNIVTGNIGSLKQMNYTMIGDGVNLAARLETACKQYATRILISEFTYQKLRGTYRIREVDSVKVKGKTKPVNIYEVLDYHTDESFPNLMDVVNQFKSGLGYYRKTNWDKALGSFQEALSLHPKDELCQMYINRCHYFKENPPGEDWDGVWVMKKK